MAKLVWIVYRDNHDVIITHDVHSIWSTLPLAKNMLVALAKRHEVTTSATETALFKTSQGYSGFTIEYREVNAF